MSRSRIQVNKSNPWLKSDYLVGSICMWSDPDPLNGEFPGPGSAPKMQQIRSIVSSFTYQLIPTHDKVDFFATSEKKEKKYNLTSKIVFTQYKKCVIK